MESKFFILYGMGTIVTLASGLGGIYWGLKKGGRVSSFWSSLIIAMSLYLLVGQIFKLYALKNYADFATWLEIINNISRGRGAKFTLLSDLGNLSTYWFSAHFTPFVFLFSTPYLIVDLPEVLLTTQYILMSSSLLAVYLLARREFDDRAGALAAAAIFSLFPTYQYINLYEMEMLRFCIPALFFAFYFLESGRLKLYWAFLAAAVLMREEVGITTFLFGIYIYFFFPNRRGIGVLTSLLSLAYFLLVILVVMPSFRSGTPQEHIVAYWWAPLGKTMPEVLLGIATKPWLAISIAAEPLKLANLFLYLLPLLFVPVLAFPVLLVAAGNVGMNLLSGSITHTSYVLYYLSPSIPFLFIAFIKGVPILGEWIKRGRLSDGGGAKQGISAVLCGAFSAALMANLFFGPSPLSLQFWFKDLRVAPFRTENFHYSNYEVTDHARRLKKILEAVPKDASVSAEQHLLPSLYDRKFLKVFPDIKGVNYVVIDKKFPLKTGVTTVPGSWDGLRENPQYYYDWMEKDPDRWNLVASEDGYFVYRRKAQEPQGQQ